MKVLFVGPTLYGLASPGHRIIGTDILCRAPAQQGDILRAVLDGASAVGLIDGRYEDVAAPWHKEILFALSRGVAVCGGASMGALRAAECAAFGMVPVGRVAARYLSGELLDDAAVAQIHGPPELGCPPLSEALVNIEATIDAALQAGTISDEDAGALRTGARRLFFKDRTYQAVARAAGFGDGDAAAVVASLKACRRDVKREDALELIAVLRGPVVRPDTTSWVFQETTAWRRFARAIERPGRPLSEDAAGVARPGLDHEAADAGHAPVPVADYISEVAPQLASMARNASLSRLASLLGMVAIDVRNAAKGLTGRGQSSDGR